MELKGILVKYEGANIIQTIPMQDFQNIILTPNNTSLEEFKRNVKKSVGKTFFNDLIKFPFIGGNVRGLFRLENIKEDSEIIEISTKQICQPYHFNKKIKPYPYFARDGKKCGSCEYNNNCPIASEIILRVEGDSIP